MQKQNTKTKTKNGNKGKNKVIKRLKELANINKRAKNNKVRKLQFQGSDYLNCLLNPESVHGAKIPGSAVPVVSIHRRIIQRYTTNANGCIGISFFPEGTLVDNSSVAIPLRLCNVSTYTGTTAPAVGDVLLQTATNPFSLPVDTVKQFRLVSSSITCRSLASALTRSGDIHIALVNGYYHQSGIVSSSSDQANFLSLSNIDNLVQGKYTYARVENGQSARAIWIPQDVSCLDFKDINNGIQQTDNFISIIGIGLAASSSVEVVMDFNWEVTSKVGSLLQGMESFCTENIDPLRVWRTAYSLRPPCIATKDIGAYAATSVITSKGLKPSADIFSKPSDLYKADLAAAKYAEMYMNNISSQFNNPGNDIEMVIHSDLRR